MSSRQSHRTIAASAPIAITAVLALTQLAPAAAQRSIAEIEARQWSAEPLGSFAIEQAAIIEALDLETDLALAEDDAIEGRLTFRPSKRAMIRVGYLPEIALAGDNVVSRSFSFLNQAFTFDERVVTSFDIEYGRIGLAWQFAGGREGRVRIGPIVEAKGFRADLALSAPDVSPAAIETESYEAAFGAAGLIADIELSDRLELFGEYTTSVTSNEADITETEFGVRYLPTPSVALIAGARTLEIDIRETTAAFLFELDGVFFGASVRF